MSQGFIDKHENNLPEINPKGFHPSSIYPGLSLYYSVYLRSPSDILIYLQPILFEQGGLATLCNPATWMLRSRSRRMFELLTDFVPKRYTS